MATEKRLIDASALKIHRMYNAGANHPLDVAYRKDIDNAPTVDAVEVKHGRWIRKPIGKYTGVYEVCCAICGCFVGVVASDTAFREAIEGMNYCLNCGAKMDGDGNGC